MKPAPFDYVAPTSLDEACRVLSEAGGGATLLAGGQTLMPLLNLRMSQPFIVIDLNKVADLRGVTHGDGATRVGAMTRQADALRDPALARHVPVMVEALGHVGHYQTRNRGTIGGSVALGEPAAEMPATAVALGAELELQSVRGTRRVNAADFYIGPYMTAIEPDEILTAIHYPDWPDDHVTLFREVAQRPGDFALVGMVGALARESGAVVRAGLAFFGMGPAPVSMKQAEAAMVGQSVASLDAGALASLAVADCAPFDDHHASAEYRRTVGRRIFARTLRDALDLRKAA